MPCARTIIRAALHPAMGIARVGNRPWINLSLNFSQFVAGRRWWPWAREGLEEARGFAGDEPCYGEEIRRASARFYALQRVIN
ncbi:MAG: hypothetical protein ACJ8DI_14915 [Ktedonobacteraceae bacterium]